MEGLTADTSEPVLVVAQEWPATSGSSQTERTKEELERLHLDQYCTDHLLATRQIPYTQLERGSGRVDFSGVQADAERVVGIDMTQFALASRRRAEALFGLVLDAVLDRPRSSQGNAAGGGWSGDH